MSIRLKSNKTSINICVDIDNSIIIKKRKFLVEQLSNVVVHKLSSFVSIREVKDKIIKFDEYVKIQMFFDDVLKSKNIVVTSAIEVIDVKIHVIDDFVVNFLLNNDVIYFQDMKINSKKRRFIIIKCENIRVSLKIQNRFTSHVKRNIRFRRVYILMSNELTKVSITYHDTLSNDRNFLFEFRCQHDLKYENEIYAHVMNNNFVKMLVRNVIFKSIILTRRVKLKIVIEYNQTECYLIMSKKFHKTINN